MAVARGNAPPAGGEAAAADSSRLSSRRLLPRTNGRARTGARRHQDPGRSDQAAAAQQGRGPREPSLRPALRQSRQRPDPAHRDLGLHRRAFRLLRRSAPAGDSIGLDPARHGMDGLELRRSAGAALASDPRHEPVPGGARAARCLAAPPSVRPRLRDVRGGDGGLPGAAGGVRSGPDRRLRGVLQLSRRPSGCGHGTDRACGPGASSRPLRRCPRRAGGSSRTHSARGSSTSTGVASSRGSHTSATLTRGIM